jgi:hypothetical protein
MVRMLFFSASYLWFSGVLPMFRKFSLLCLTLGLLSLTQAASAQTTANQTFTVRVPTNISITAPSNVLLDHDETENNQSFPNQSWAVKGNVQNGVTVSFATNQAFTHTTDNTQKRNAKLDLALASSNGPATWNISKATDTTDYANNDGEASVQVSSNGVGRANFNVAVTFITNGYGTFLAGDYQTTVTGTVTAN